MKKLIKVRFKPTGRVYDFDSGAFVLKSGDRVIVETEQGLGLGIVVAPPKSFDEQQHDRLLKKVFRLANEKDLYQQEKNCNVEKSAYAYCFKRIKELKLKMHLFSVESSFDGNKLTFFFTSEGRVDFRILVKMLTKELGVRIDLRQVGIRHKAKMFSGIGRCGRMICCSAFIDKFAPVSIRMAKNQNLSLNPTKISGLCGRLMCCLTFENDTYKALMDKFPKPHKTVTTKKGKGKVLRLNVISNRLTIRLDDGQEIETGLDEIIQEQKHK